MSGLVPATLTSDSLERRELARVLARESAETLAGAGSGVRVAVLARLLAPAAHAVAARFVDYDRALGERGQRAGAEWILERAATALDVSGADGVPREGPLLVVANHPGVCDAVALLAALGRDDAWIVVAEYPFLRALRHAGRRFLFVPHPRRDGRSALRDVVSRLRGGESVLLFPAGHLELDPAIGPDDARRSLGSWSRSVALIPRLVRDVQVLPAVVSGAISRAAFDHPLARRRHPASERQRMAALLQLALPRYHRGRVSVHFGEPIRGDDAVATYATVLERMDALLSTIAARPDRHAPRLTPPQARDPHATARHGSADPAAPVGVI